MIWGVNPCRVDGYNHLQNVWGGSGSTQLPIQWLPEILFLGVGVVGAAGALSYPLPPPSVRVTNEWSHTLPSQLPVR